MRTKKNATRKPTITLPASARRAAVFNHERRAPQPNGTSITDAISAVNDLRSVAADRLALQDGEIDRLNAAVESISSSMAAARVGGGSIAVPDNAGHRDFNAFVRKGTINATMRVASDPDGGWLVPSEVDKTIGRVMRNINPMRQICKVVSISTGVYRKITNIGRAASGWVGESESRPTTQNSSYSLKTPPVGDLYEMPRVTSQLLDDADYDLANDVVTDLGNLFSLQEATSFVTGNGVGRPRGFTTETKVANASHVWGKLGFIVTGAAATLNATNPADNMVDLVHALPSMYRSPYCCFVMNTNTLAVVRKMKDGEGRYLWTESLVAGMPSRLMGYPVYEVPEMDDIGANAYPIAFGDFMQGYTIIDKGPVKLLRDPYTDKPHVLFYATKRVGSAVMDYNAIKLLKCST